MKHLSRICIVILIFLFSITVTNGQLVKANSGISSSYKNLVIEAKKGKLYGINGIANHMTKSAIEKKLGKGKEAFAPQDHSYFHYKAATVLYSPQNKAVILSYKGTQIKNKNLIQSRAVVEKILGKPKQRGFYNNTNEYYITYKFKNYDLSLTFGKSSKSTSRVTNIAVSYNYGY